MEFKLAEFDNLLHEIQKNEALEKNIEKIIRNINAEIEFQSLGVFLIDQIEQKYSIVNYRNLSENFIGSFYLLPDDSIIKNLTDKRYIEIFDPQKYKFEKDFTHLIVFPVHYKEFFFGLLFVDRKDVKFSKDDISKLEMFNSIICMQIQIFKQQFEIEKIKKIDEITGAFTLHSFLEQGNFLLAQTNRYHRYLTLIVLGIDKYELLKNKFGGKYINKLRKKIAESLQKDLRESDLVGIIDENHFAILMPETPVSIIYKAIERLNSVILQIPEMKNNIISWGIAGKDENIKNIKQLMNEALEAEEESEYKSEDKITFYH